MKKAILAILLFSSMVSMAQNSVNVDQFKIDPPKETNHKYSFAVGVLFTGLGASKLLNENKTSGDKFQNYSAIGFGIGLMSGSIIFDIRQEKQKRKIVDP